MKGKIQVMSKFQLKDKAEAYEVIKAAIKQLGRSDTPFSYGAVSDKPTEEQIVFFDLPRISPLQFNIPTVGITDRQQLIERIKAAIVERLESD